MDTDKKFGVTLSMVKEDLVKAALAGLRIEVAPTLPEMVGQLVGHYRKTAPNVKNLALCDCGGVFPNELAACPYCGDADEDPKPEKPAKAAAKAPKADATKAAVAAVAAIVDKPKASAIVKATVLPDSLAGLSGKDLDFATAEVIRLKTNSATTMWELGSKLRDIHERQLWKLRMDDKGKPTYRSFEAYCAAEVQMSHSTCYGLIKVCEAYTSDKVALLGTSKLNLILKAPEEDRSSLEDDAKSGMSKEALRKKVASLRATKGAPKPKAAKVARGAAPPVGKGRPSEHITIVSVIGKKTLPCYVKPVKKDDAMVAVQCPAAVQAWLAKQQPVAFDDLTNGVREVFILTHNTKGELQIKVDRKRLDPKAT